MNHNRKKTLSIYIDGENNVNNNSEVIKERNIKQKSQENIDSSPNIIVTTDGLTLPITTPKPVGGFKMVQSDNENDDSSIILNNNRKQRDYRITKNSSKEFLMISRNSDVQNGSNNPANYNKNNVNKINNDNNKDGNNQNFKNNRNQDSNNQAENNPNSNYNGYRDREKEMDGMNDIKETIHKIKEEIQTLNSIRNENKNLSQNKEILSKKEEELYRLTENFT